MNPSPLPFEILGQIGPILAWAEGDDGSRLPSAWTTESVPLRERERSWLSHELPTYSYDNVEEIVRGSRVSHRGPRPVSLPFSAEKHKPSLSPPPDYDLLQTFRYLNEYFFIWNGTEPCIREGRMEELHELAIRLPMGHVVRHSHARAVSEGVVRFNEALSLPELVTLLPSNSFGLRSVVRRGLSESHLHLKGVISAEETWANSLLGPLAAQSLRARTSAERRLLMLNLFAGRLLALAVSLSWVDTNRKLYVEPWHLLELLDEIYFARTVPEERFAAKRLEDAIRRVVRPLEPVEMESDDTGSDEPRGEERKRDSPRRSLISDYVPPDYRFLLRWIAPTAFRVQALQRGKVLPGSSLEGPRERYRLVRQLHLIAHLRLVQLSSVQRASERDDESRRAKDESAPRGQHPRRYFLHEALFRYLICRTHHWQQATQQGKTTGLRYFREFYGSRQRRASELTELQYAELVFHRLRQWRGLRVLEGRVSPPRRPQDLVPWILAYARPEDRRIRKFGLVVHFKKEEEEKEEKSFSRQDAAPTPRLRWGRRRRRIRDEGMRLYRLLQRPTPVAPFVVGIDACNLELSTPPEVFAPVFRFLRELPIALSGGRRRYSPYFELEPVIRELVGRRRIGMTFHVGEDFRHLLSGLRAIFEVVHFLCPNPGDRLGHGTALALDPQDWLKHNGYQAVLPKLEWLDTLVWVHHFLGPGDDLVGELAIEDRIQRLSWEVYSRAVTDHFDPFRLDRTEPKENDRNPRRGLLDWNWAPPTLWDAWLLRQLDPYSIDLRKLLRGQVVMRPYRSACEEERRWHSVQERVLRKVRAQIGSRNACVLLALYWMSPKVRKEGEKILVIDMKRERSRWLELCTRVESKMKRLIHEKELVVEVNPSSNRIIGPMARYGEHHVFQLTLDEDRRLSRQVRVSVNTDNPAVCNTTLAHEHYLLGEILIGEGIPEAEVVKWLEWLRSNGEDYNFVRRLKTPEEDPLMDRLMQWLRSIRPTVLEARSRGEKLEAFWRWLRVTHLRGHGFPQKVIERDPDFPERLIAVEHLVGELRNRGPESEPERRLLGKRLESELAELRARLLRLEDEQRNSDGKPQEG